MTDFNYQNKFTLKHGDRVKISGGPYYLKQDGTKVSMGENGIFMFIQPADNGILVKEVSDMDKTVMYIYLGPEKISEKTGTYMRPHKLSLPKTVKKKRKKKE